MIFFSSICLLFFQITICVSMGYLIQNMYFNVIICIFLYERRFQIESQKYFVEQISNKIYEWLSGIYWK